MQWLICFCLIKFTEKLHSIFQDKPKKDYADSDSGSESGSDDEDIEKAMAKEASEIKDKTPAQRRFQNVDCKAKNCIFIKTTLDSPTEVAHAILADLDKTKVQKTRHAIRMLPVEATCKAVMKNIEETAQNLFKAYFETEFGVGIKYSSVCKIRNNQSISRMAILPNLGRIIKEMNPLHSLCYDEPDLVILIEIIRNICCISVIKDFFRFRKYNLHEVVKPKENKEQGTLEDKSSVEKKDAKGERTDPTDNSEKSVATEKSVMSENYTTNIAEVSTIDSNGKVDGGENKVEDNLEVVTKADNKCENSSKIEESNEETIKE